MNAVERQKRIQELLTGKDFMSVEDLSGVLQASMATIRRDLTALEESGVLTRYRGGAVLSANGAKKALNIELRMDQNREVKERLYSGPRCDRGDECDRAAGSADAEKHPHLYAGWIYRHEL